MYSMTSIVDDGSGDVDGEDEDLTCERPLNFVFKANPAPNLISQLEARETCPFLLDHYDQKVNSKENMISR